MYKVLLYLMPLFLIWETTISTGWKITRDESEFAPLWNVMWNLALSFYQLVVKLLPIILPFVVIIWLTYFLFNKFSSHKW